MIYVVLPNLNVSGGIKAGCQWVRTLRKNDHEALVVVPTGNPQTAEWLGFGSEVLCTTYPYVENGPGNTVVFNWLDQLREVGDAWDKCQRFYFAQDCAQPLYVETEPGRFEREYLPRLRACQLITVSHATRRWYLHRYSLRSTVVHNWVDGNVFYSNGGDQKPDFDVAMIRHRDHFHPDVYQALIQDGYVVAVAEGGQQEVAEVLRRSAVFVSCARGRLDGQELSEGLPFPILEAMTCGCAPVCPDTNGVRDLVIPRLNGLLVENSAGTNDYVGAVREAFAAGVNRLRRSALETAVFSFAEEDGEDSMLRALSLR